MKQTLYLKIAIDTDNDAPSKAGFRRISPSEAIGNIQITSEVPKYNGDLLSVTAHEVGHAIAKLFGDKSHVVDATFQNMGWRDHDLSVAVEKKAWDIARKTGIPIDGVTRDHALQSYIDEVDMVPIAKDTKRRWLRP